MKCVRKTACASCPFLGLRPLDLETRRTAEIAAYLMQGSNHLCHSDHSGQTVCRGGRQIQLEVWTAQGVLPEPTDAALADAMRKQGIEPGPHITETTP